MNSWTDDHDPMWSTLGEGLAHPEVIVIYRHCGWSAWRCWLARTVLGHHHIVEVLRLPPDETHVWKVE